MKSMVLVLASALIGLSSPCLAQSQQSDIPTGLIFLDPSQYQSIPLASTPLMGDLPHRADLSRRFPAPGSQGGQSSCVGWAVAYLKSYQEAVERNWSLDSEDRVFSPAYIYNQIRQTPDCKAGTLFVDALNLVRREGAAPLSRFPYAEVECSRVPDPGLKQFSRQFNIADWRRVNTQDETEVKNHIAAGFPVLIGMIIDRQFYNLRGPATYSNFTGESLGGHAMVVVGYDDDKQAFRVINSWGQQWGDGGFGWISYQAFRRAVREGYVAQDIIVQPPSPAPQPSPTPAPVPIRVAPAAMLGGLIVQHNVTVSHPAGLAPGPGMAIRVTGTLSNASGKNVQIVVRFFLPDGRPLLSNPAEPSYRDASGLVATGTIPMQVSGNSTELGAYPISIPYYALNFQPTNGAMTYNLTMVAFIYLDNFVIAQSTPQPFLLRW